MEAGDGPPLAPVKIGLLALGLLDVTSTAPLVFEVVQVRLVEQAFDPVAMVQVEAEEVRVPVGGVTEQFEISVTAMTPPVQELYEYVNVSDASAGIP
jgi:hypothetical protein